jgi:hypothetical protein
MILERLKKLAMAEGFARRSKSNLARRGVSQMVRRKRLH